MAEGVFYDTMLRFQNLHQALENLGPEANAELYRHFPVAAISVLETDFKASVAAIIDSGTEYMQRGLALARDRLRPVTELVPILHRNAASVGDLIAHSLPFNSVSSFEVIGALLGTDIKRLIAAAVNPYRARMDGDKRPLVPDVDQLWADLTLTFERRHVLAHEAATNYVISFSDAGDGDHFRREVC